MPRLIVQGFFFIAFLFLLKGSCLICPLGWSEYLVRGGSPIPLTFIIIAGFFAISLFWGRIFCGWACPVGFILDLESLIEKKLGRKKKRSPKNENLKNVKYGILVGVFLLSMVSSKSIHYAFCPIFEVSKLIFYEIPYVLAGAIILNFIRDRAFCRYICPVGALLALFSAVGIKRKRPPSLPKASCAGCSLCDLICPVDIYPHETYIKGGRFQGWECIRCFECTKKCPILKQRKLTERS